ncbi:SDR family NAD(P)-dependent oxidoreductase [Nocardioides albus]|uniref:Short-chain dehydrogenase n=1 Tax=Nocardioides albus TaxID=1841 RepID=A0A7W5A4V8_9ACTN|nr:SDR family NAD(P)-dependent oxidoreductase [Nocardioides albus]MBB3089309.1 hypothetical protein [Nocardioides albus]GGU12855.1 short-chain dehydrogenase [Nocardioides albus]
MTTIAVLGATSGIAQACLRAWLGPEVSFRLSGRSPQALDRVAADLRTRGGDTVHVETAVHDLTDTASVVEAVDWIFGRGEVDIVLVAFGTMPSQEDADADPQVAAGLLTVNGSATVLAAHLVALRLLERGTGRLAVIGSVAGDRGRASNYLYGSAKAMVATAVGGLQHRAAGTDVRITLVKPGPTSTPMTDHLRGGKLKLASPDAVAADIVGAVEAGRQVVYTPSKWRLIITVIRLLPRPIFERSRL